MFLFGMLKSTTPRLAGRMSVARRESFEHGITGEAGSAQAVRFEGFSRA
jgi:hypothetical protein